MYVEQSLPMIIEGADRPDPVLLSDVDRALPPERIEFSVLAGFAFLIEPGTVGASHFLYLSETDVIFAATPCPLSLLGKELPQSATNQGRSRSYAKQYRPDPYHKHVG